MSVVMANSILFQSRQDAGKQLARELQKLPLDAPLVMGIAKGGIPVGAEVAKALHCPLDVLVIRKLKALDGSDRSIGAISEDGHYTLSPDEKAEALRMPALFEEMLRIEEENVAHQVRMYRGNRPLASVAGCTVILVDDGLVTGETAQLACRLLARKGATLIVVAAPVCAAPCAERLENEAHAVITLSWQPRLVMIGQHYLDFAPVTDWDIVSLLSSAEISRSKPEPGNAFSGPRGDLEDARFRATNAQTTLQNPNTAVHKRTYSMLPRQS